MYSSDAPDIPKKYKVIYSHGPCGKHIKAEHDTYVLKLRKILSTLNQKTYEEYFHHLLWFEEATARECLQKQSLKRVKVKYATSANKFTIIVPGMVQKQRYVRTDDHVLLISLLDPTRRLRAKITDITGNSVTFSMITKFSRISENEEFTLIFLFSNYQYECMHEAVHNIMSSKHSTKVFPKKNEKCNKKIPIITWMNPDISRNAEQRTAVEHIVGGTSAPAPFLLHGPPGTGKTATIVEAILQVLRNNPSSKIMVCTPSNSAADDVACKLTKYEFLSSMGIDLFLWRQNSSKRDWSTLPPCLSKYSNSCTKIIDREAEIMRVRRATIVISTISYAWHAVGSGTSGSTGYLTHLFIDEAAQATEPLCLLPITKLLAPDGLLILSGDPLQLGPVLVSKHAQEYGLGTSLMERLMEESLYKRNDPNYTVMLKKNYRSHADILHIPNHQFYNGQLEACAKEDVISRRNILDRTKGCRAIAFYAVLGQEAQEKQSSSYFNEDELNILKYCIKKIIQGNPKEEPEHIGIITPYRAQVDKMKKWLDSQGLNKIEVGSVESYQGREKKIILMSTVRGQGADSTKKAKLGFVADSKRFNVALTRAKAKLIVIGNPDCLKTENLWRIYMETCKKIGSYYRCNVKDASESKRMQNLTSGLRKLRINK